MERLDEHKKESQRHHKGKHFPCIMVSLLASLSKNAGMAFLPEYQPGYVKP